MKMFQEASTKNMQSYLYYITVYSGMLLPVLRKKLVAGYSVKMVNSYKIAWFNNPEETALNCYHVRQLKSIKIFVLRTYFSVSSLTGHPLKASVKTEHFPLQGSEKK
jgi:hypothetical protein